MSTRLCLLLVGWFACLATSAAHAVPRPGASSANGELVRAKLLADVSAIQPGQPFTVGVLLTIEPGWHVYWKNPGDSGLSTSAKWTLPEGFKAGDLQFPVPTRFDLEGGLVNYGYHDEVMLTATI